MHVFWEFEDLNLAARIATRLGKFLHDVFQGWQANLLGNVFFDVNFQLYFFLTGKFFEGNAHILSHFLHHGITFGVHSAVIEWVFAARNTQEAGTLLKGFFAQPGNLLQICPGLKGTFFLAVIHDILRNLRSQSRYVGEQVFTGCIEVYAYQVYTALYNPIEWILEFGLIYVVLVLPHPDWFGIYFDQFGQRIGKTSGDRDCATHGNIKFGKFVAGHFGSRIDGCTTLIYNEYLHIAVEFYILDKTLCLPAGSSVTNGNGLNFKGIYQAWYLFGCHGGLTLWRMRVNIFVMQQVALGIQTNHLTAGAKPGIYTHNCFLSQWWSQQQLAQVFGKHPDGLLIGFFFGQCPELSFYGRAQQSFVTVGYGSFYLLSWFISCFNKNFLQNFQGIFIGWFYA